MSQFAASGAPISDPTATAAAVARARQVADFARSELFERTFQEGMDLVEETAAYLDGGGRQDSKLLSRSAALASLSGNPSSARIAAPAKARARWRL